MNAAPTQWLPGVRTRLATVGLLSLSDGELLTLVLGTGARGRSARELSTALLHTTGGVRGLARMGAGELSSHNGIGHCKAARLVASFELGRRAASLPLDRSRPLCSSEDVAAELAPLLAPLEEEHFIAIPADARNRPLGRIAIAKGGLHTCPVSPADVFRALLRAAASAVVFIHNHPSGDPSPSPEDIALTARLVEAGDIVGIRVLDHVIIGSEGHFSFADTGLMIPGGAS